MDKLKDKVAIVTGGATGIGKAITKNFLSEGCNVVIAARDLSRLEKVVKELSTNKADILSIKTDITKESEVEDLFSLVIDKYGRLDILVNNSGAFDGGVLEGKIINIGSIAAQRARHNSVPYTTSKHAVWGLTQASALEGRDFGIAVSSIHPGNVAVERRSDGRSSTGRDEGPEPLINPEEIGETALLMASLPKNSNMLEAIILPLSQDYLGRG